MLKNIALVTGGLMVGFIFVLGAQPESTVSPAAPISKEGESARLTLDFYDEAAFTIEEKRILEEGSLNVLNNERNCDRVVYGDCSTSRKGTYFVTCEPKNGGHTFNVWFTPKQLQNSRKRGCAYGTIAGRRGRWRI